MERRAMHGGRCRRGRQEAGWGRGAGGLARAASCPAATLMRYMSIGGARVSGQQPTAVARWCVQSIDGHEK